MADYMTPATGSRRIVLIFLLLGITGMLATSLVYRIKSPGLVVESRQAGMQQRAGESGMDPEIGKLMEKLRDNPNDIPTIIHLTEHLMSDQNWQAAETFAMRAAAAEPGNAQPMYMLGIIQHNQGRHAEAAASLERMINLKDDASARYSLGVLYIHYLNEPAKGVAQLSAALHDQSANEELKKAIRAELEKAPLPQK